MLPGNTLGNIETLVKAAAAAGRLGPGRNFYVSSTNAQHLAITDSDTNSGLTPLDPLSTIDYAIGLCTAGRGDNIICLPGHTEDITTAAAIVFDVADVTLLGLGTGSARPTITCSGTTDTTDINITAANVTIDNVYFDMTGNDSVAAFIDVDAADCTFRNCYFLLADSGGQVDIGVDVGTGSHRCKFHDCTFFGDTAESVAITVSAAVTEFEMQRCRIDAVGATSPGLIEFTAVATNIFMKDCYFANRVASATTTVDFNANACTGMFVNVHSVLGTIATAGSGILPFESTGQAAYIGLIECYCVNDQAAGGAGEAGALVGAVSS